VHHGRLPRRDGAGSSVPTPVWHRGFPRRSFPDYATDELVTIFQQAAARAGYTLAEDTASAVGLWLDALPRGKGFGNGREARNLFEAAIARHAARVVTIEAPTDDDLTVLLAADVAGVETGSDWRHDH
jgi:hypothetical protein